MNWATQSIGDNETHNTRKEASGVSHHRLWSKRPRKSSGTNKNQGWITVTFVKQFFERTKTTLKSVESAMAIVPTDEYYVTPLPIAE